MPRMSVRIALPLGLATILASYAWYSREAAVVHAVLGGKLPLSKPLSELPLTLGAWVGSEQPLEEEVVLIAAADEHINRSYRNARTGDMLRLYIPYYGNPRTMVGHYPARCYIGGGWTKTDGTTATVPLPEMPGRQGCPVLIERFQRGPARVTVATFYIVAGKYTANRNDARRASHKAITAENRNYYAQVWITLSGAPPKEQVVRVLSDFLQELLPELEKHLPDAGVQREVASR